MISSIAVLYPMPSKWRVASRFSALVLLAAWAATPTIAGPPSASEPGPGNPIDAARGVIQRWLGDRASHFRFRIAPAAKGGLDFYEVEARAGIVTVVGNSPVSLAHGAYSYLRDACHCFTGWTGEHVDLPGTFPDWPAQRVVSPYALRPYYNVCTLGYTMAYWGWDQWQRELDWMALHGISLALAEVATEAIWQRVWLAEGITQDELDRYFTGPAFFPWHRMGNINRWDGPPPTGFFGKQIILQKKIVARMRELGIEPIAPAFAGFVPPDFRRVHPRANLHKLSGWGGFSADYGTYLLDPLSTLYPEIGRRFIREWEGEFGRNKYFLADSFNELKVPVPPDRPGRVAQLARYGDAVYRSIIAGEPSAVWIMQGWLFYNDADFWDHGSVAALLSKVPDERMVILDLACDFRPIWSSQDAFYGKPWVYSVIHNFGGKTTLGGDLRFFAANGAETLAAPRRGRLVGYGLAPEGVENNEVVYELITDAMWSREAIDLAPWLGKFCLARYGGCPPAMIEAWRLLVQSCYAQDIHHSRPRYQYAPLAEIPERDHAPDDSPGYLQAVKLFLGCAPALGGNVLFRADAIEFDVQYLGSRIDALIAAALQAHGRGDAAGRDRYAAAALDLMDDVDSLLAAHPIHRLERWTRFARSWGDTAAESDYFEADAKYQLTTWGPTGEITDYASKAWSGLTRDYYRQRWEKTFQGLASGQSFNLLPWERHWIETPVQPSASSPAEDVIPECRRLLAKGESWQRRIDQGSGP